MFRITKTQRRILAHLLERGTSLGIGIPDAYALESSKSSPVRHWWKLEISDAGTRHYEITDIGRAVARQLSIVPCEWLISVMTDGDRDTLLRMKKHGMLYEHSGTQTETSIDWRRVIKWSSTHSPGYILYVHHEGGKRWYKLSERGETVVSKLLAGA
jgi:hypothetical protein